MSYIKFDKTKLINLEYALEREVIRSNRSGSFACTTINFCNTRKYHGLLIAPQPQIDNENHVLLSTIHETIIQHEKEFNIGINKYPGTYNPKGHKYIEDLETDTIPNHIYRVGGVLLKKEILLSQNESKILIKYTLLEAHSETKIRIKPFLAYRNIHKLSKANNYVDKKFEEIENGIRLRMYQGYSSLYFQINKKEFEYIHCPDWYNNIEYIREIERGYEGHEDLYVPGFFEIPIKKGEEIILSIGTIISNTKYLKTKFKNEIINRTPRNNFKNCLINSAEQFFVIKENFIEIIAGFPWFGRWGRDTFISLPGLTLSLGKLDLCKKVLNTMIKDLKGPLFPNIGTGNNAALNSVDASLWFIWAVQKYASYLNDNSQIWKLYGKSIKTIIQGYIKGTLFSIKMHDNGLIWAGENGVALTWMDAVISGKPVTPRTGFQVEINALWYNSISYAIELAQENNDINFANELKIIQAKTIESFNELFWDDNLKYLADYVDYENKNMFVRPNMIFAASLPYTMLTDDQINFILDKIQKELLTPRGLRTLSPKNPNYQGVYNGDQSQRDNAYHQGTVWPWLIGHYAEAYLRIHGKSGIKHIQNLINGFEEVIDSNGIGSISEIYDGDPPHNAKGTISQAWSVSEILRTMELIEKYN